MALLNRADRPTAIFAGSDMQAMGVLRAARRLGIEVPAQLSVIGYDNLSVAAWTDPALTTVDQPPGTWPAPRPGCCSTWPADRALQLTRSTW